MKRRYAIFAVTFVVSLLIGIQVVEVVDANPLSMGLPNQGEFSVTIETPSNNTIFKKSNIPLNFIVNYTEQWNLYPYWCRIASIASIDVYLDGNLSIQHTSNQVDYYLNGTKTTYTILDGPSNYSDWLNQTSPGEHMLNVTANFSVQYHGNLMSWSEQEVTSKIVYFIVEPQVASASPIPSSPTDLLSNSMALIAVVFVIVILVVVSVSLVYFRRRKDKP